jgi:hypothetical protein
VVEETNDPFGKSMKRIAEAIMILFLVSASGATAFGQVFAGDMQRPKKEPEVVKDNRKPKQDEKKGDDRRQKDREEPKKRDDRRRPEFR